MGESGIRIWSGSEAKSPINHMVVMFQVRRISLNVHPEILNNERLLVVSLRIFKRLGQ